MTYHFHTGQQVVCIDAEFKYVSNPQGIKEGEVYTLRWVGPYKSYVDGEYIGVRLVGVERGACPSYGYDDPPFFARRFRPLVSDHLGFARAILTDPDGYRGTGPEEPKVPVKEREKEPTQ
jgi:hypothetical protein